MGEEHLLLVGASVRAAAFSALRAGLRPWCVDLFADADLAARCPVQALPASRYPRGLVDVFKNAPPGPWMYTGALENRPKLVRRLARRRRLWGSNVTGLRAARDHEFLCNFMNAFGVRAPDIIADPTLSLRSGCWLVKPRAGAGGRGIRFWPGGPLAQALTGRVYVQEYIQGQPCAAVYLSDSHQAHLLGVTRQLVGEDWLHAAPFHYCGSIGPLAVTPALRHSLERISNFLDADLLGLFGVDYVLRDGVPYPVEVNPRYTASVELLEHATGTPALALHRRVFDPEAPKVAPRPPASDTLGKAILFARAPLVFPADGPWTAALRQPADVWELPAFADIPHPGTPIEAGRPVLTFFARAASVASCLPSLRQIAADLDRWLYR